MEMRLNLVLRNNSAKYAKNLGTHLALLLFSTR